MSYRFLPFSCRLALIFLASLLAPGHAQEPSVPQWIWLAEGQPRRKSRIYLHKTFVVAGPVKEAHLVASCDRQVGVRLNGESVYDSRYWKDPELADVTDKLRMGENFFVVRGVTGTVGNGALLRLRYTTADGRTHDVVSDGTWRANGITADRDGDGWTPAIVVAPMGGGPWGDKVTVETLDKARELPPQSATPAAELSVAEGFQVELLYSVPKETHGSWIGLAVDDKGRFIASNQGGGLYRFPVPPLGKMVDVDTMERLDIEFNGEERAGAHGLLWAFDSLYVMKTEGPDSATGLYRVRDTDGDDRFDEVRLLRNITGSAEHGPHSMIVSPDGESLYVVCGNFTEPGQLEKSLVPRVWQEDQLLPRMWDPSTHARGILAPGGFVARLDPDGREWEYVAIGLRNAFDIAFSPEGDLFTYDADMEYDIGSTWYRATRVLHVASGADFGWRSGSGKWPEDYADSLPSLLDIGPGSPTGIVFGTDAAFPEKYRRALYICDWSYGKLNAIHLERDGASWKATAEPFLSGSPLPLTDLVIHPRDGAMYVTVGGRGAQSGFYRVTHKGSHDVSPLVPRMTAEARLSQRLEALHAHPDEPSQAPSQASGLNVTWPHLAHDDRYVRYAARVAVESRPVVEWRKRALRETRPVAVLEVLIALARHGNREDQTSILSVLTGVRWNDLAEDGQLALLRAYALVFTRMGPPDDAWRETVASHLARYYPADSFPLNRELSRVLAYLQADGVVGKTLALLAEAPTQEEQMHYLYALRVVEGGWTPEERFAYFRWFAKTSGFRGGNSFLRFLDGIKEDALALVSEADKEALAPVLATKSADAAAPLPEPEGPGREWSVEEVLKSVGSRLAHRNFDNGEAMFTAASCFVCHRFAGRGSTGGPDLTGVAGRFNVRDLVDAVVQPSKVVSDQYQATIFQLVDGTVVSGRVVNLFGASFFVNTDMANPRETTPVDPRRVAAMQPSPTSMMPEGLLNRLNEDEVLDLLAYLLSRGDPQSPIFD